MALMQRATYAACGKMCSNLTRFFGDEDCMTIGMTEGGVALIRLKLEQMTVGWKLGGPSCGTRRCFARCDFLVGTVRVREGGRVEFEMGNNERGDE